MIVLKKFKYLSYLKQVMNEVVLYTVFEFRNDMFLNYFVFKTFVFNTV